MPVNTPVLETRLTTLMTYTRVPRAMAEGLALALRNAPDEELHRINPFAFAAARRWDPAQTVDLFVHATRVGLLDFQFNLLCPACGGIEYVLGSLDDLPQDHFYCAVCHRDIHTQLDESVEVAFTVAESVRRLELHPHADFNAYRRHYFSLSILRSEQLDAFVSASSRGFAVVPPEGSAELTFDVEPGRAYRFVSVDVHSNAFLEPPPMGGVGHHEPELHITDAGLSPKSILVAPGRCTLRVRNLGKRTVGGMLLLVDWDELWAILRAHPNRWQPYLSAKMLLSNQVFRDLFRVHSVQKDLRLALKSITLLFTDLKGSTELYDRTGDVEAYRFVQEHFRVLSESVRKHRGAIIKTMGDAIMASFGEPTDAAAAALDMMHGMEALNADMKARGHDTGLKVGLHEGPALAVHADERLDYFGQTVNVAARVQGLAHAGEIWVTREMMASPGVSSVFEGAGWTNEPQEVRLKGVGVTTAVHRLSHGSVA